WSSESVVRQFGDSRTCPQISEGAIAFLGLNCGNVQTRDVIAATSFPVQLKVSGQWSAPFAKKNNRTLGHQIGEIRRLNVVCFETGRPDLNVSQQRSLNVLAELSHSCRGFRWIRHHKGFTHSRLRHSFDQVTIHRSANAKGEDIRLVQILADVIEDTLLARN